ncbi:dihydroxyacetone phosphate acyltransferase-like [Takifugu rubripes]|uniref:dihydroxyacetone phosphate acyltransferase-like n=1 Tax=Takifugu rubripes TaxID=31033 RepID=UPI001145958A|nr:dihydroxyacetone phosphate acyltransferase-like [Takifugu rubripes]
MSSASGNCSKETGRATEEVQEEASAILEEMAQCLQLSTVRFFAFTLSKIFKTLFRSICVNEDGIQRLQQAIQEHPVVLLPSHRSYMDFLLMSYILYTYDLPLPVIAAGMDFMGMKFVGEMLRMSGAFFIRRSFGGDKLYWSVFSEYVRTMLKNGFAPVEFFLEGTRSRTSKCLTPKLGLLNIVMEPFFKGELFDVCLVPVSISYERVLEETLYARELLGVPKPKESTSGLLKARKILSEDYGSIHVYFGQPVSVRSLAEGRVNRCQFSLVPRHIPRRPSEDIQNFVNDSAYRLLRAQEDNMVLKPWVLLASLLLQDHHQKLTVGQRPGDVSRQYGAFLHWPGTARAFVETQAYHQCREEVLLKQAVVLLSCASYRNQCLHVFIRPALLALALRAASSNQKEEIFNSFSFLRNVFSNEFLLCPGAAVQDFEEACFLLLKTGALQVSARELLVPEKGRRTLHFLSSMLDPFLQGYQVTCRFLCEDSTKIVTEQQFIPAVRKFIMRQLLSGTLKYPELLSSDLQKNILAALVRLGAVSKIKGPEQTTLRVDPVMANSLEDTLGGKLPARKAATASL